MPIRTILTDKMELPDGTPHEKTLAQHLIELLKTETTGDVIKWDEIANDIRKQDGIMLVGKSDHNNVYKLVKDNTRYIGTLRAQICNRMDDALKQPEYPIEMKVTPAANGQLTVVEEK